MLDSLRLDEVAQWLATETDREFNEPPEAWDERPVPVRELYRQRIRTILSLMGCRP